MPPPWRPRIVDLEWDDRNERHVEEHLGAWLVEEMIEGGDWLAFRNDRGHPPEHRLFIGRAPNGVFVTAILRELSEPNPGTWRPITGWLSTDTERSRFLSERQRQGKHDD